MDNWKAVMYDLRGEEVRVLLQKRRPVYGIETALEILKVRPFISCDQRRISKLLYIGQWVTVQWTVVSQADTLK
jgi:hypothetical protein